MFDSTAAYFTEEHVDRGAVATIGSGASISATAPHRCPYNSTAPAGGSAGISPAIGLNCNTGPGGHCVPGGTQTGGYPMTVWSDSDVWNGLNFQQEQGHF